MITDIRGHWAERRILEVARAGIVDAFENHTFQPRAVVRRVDFAQAVSRLLNRVAVISPNEAARWRNARGTFPDVAPSNVAYAAASRRRRLGRNDDRRGWHVPADDADLRHRGDRRARAGARPQWDVGPATMNALTPANQLTLLRMLLIPAFVILVIDHYLGWALIVFVVAGLTDALDGLIARRTGQKSTLGAWLDPMADKMLAVSTFVVLTVPGLGLANQLPFLADDNDHHARCRHRGHGSDCESRNRPADSFRPSVWGKIATATYMLTAVVAMFFNFLGYHSQLVDAFIWASLGITLVSSFHYIFTRRASSTRRPEVPREAHPRRMHRSRSADVLRRTRIRPIPQIGRWLRRVRARSHRISMRRRRRIRPRTSSRSRRKAATRERRSTAWCGWGWCRAAIR